MGLSWTFNIFEIQGFVAPSIMLHAFATLQHTAHASCCFSYPLPERTLNQPISQWTLAGIHKSGLILVHGLKISADRISIIHCIHKVRSNNDHVTMCIHVVHKISLFCHFLQIRILSWFALTICHIEHIFGGKKEKWKNKKFCVQIIWSCPHCHLQYRSLVIGRLQKAVTSLSFTQFCSNFHWLFKVIKTLQ